MPCLKWIEVLMELHRLERSCILRFERGSAKKQFVVMEGRLAYAESNTPCDHLAQILLGMNRIARKDLKNIAAAMKTGLTSDQAIVQAAGVGDTDILSGLKEQALVIAASLLSWSACEPRFLRIQGLPGRRCRLDLDIPTFIMEAVRRAVASGAASAQPFSSSAAVRALPLTGMRALLPLEKAESFCYSELRDAVSWTELSQREPIGDWSMANLIQILLLVDLAKLETPPGHTAAAENDPIEHQVEEMMRRFEVSNYYEVLSVPSSATPAEIKEAYYALARRYHPDRYAARETSPVLRANIENLFTFITRAYSTLIQPGTRNEYDERLHRESVVEAKRQGKASAAIGKENMAEALFRAGIIAFRQNLYDQAVERLRESVWLQPEVARYHYHLALAQTEIPSCRKDAEQQLQQAIALEPTNPDYRVQLGKLYLRVNLPHKAEAQFHEALQWDPEHAEAHSLLSQPVQR
jgi:curved DNA-binding protein CbpA